jgi:hypothetical protein
MTNLSPVCPGTKRNKQENPLHRGTIADRLSPIVPADMFISNYIIAREAQKPKAQSTKHNFECIAKESGVQIKAYRADNGIFAKREIASSAAAQNQILTFCGVGAHHHKGIAEG